jgi:hypothetical protein
MAFSPLGSIVTQSVTGTAGGIGAANIPDNAEYAEGFVRTAPVVFSTDGATTPTSTKGTVANQGDIIVLRGRQEIKNFSAVREGGTSASIDWEFYTAVPSMTVAV